MVQLNAVQHDLVVKNFYYIQNNDYKNYTCESKVGKIVIHSSNVVTFFGNRQRGFLSAKKRFIKEEEYVNFEFL